MHNREETGFRPGTGATEKVLSAFLGLGIAIAIAIAENRFAVVADHGGLGGERIRYDGMKLRDLPLAMGLLFPIGSKLCENYGRRPVNLRTAACEDRLENIPLVWAEQLVRS